MRAALYYPGWGVADPYFMFESLLYWDRLACIVPYDEFPPSAQWPPGFEREAQLLHERFVSGIDRLRGALRLALAPVDLESDSTGVEAQNRGSFRAALREGRHDEAREIARGCSKRAAMRRRMRSGGSCGRLIRKNSGR